MDISLHLKQGLTLLEKVLKFYPMLKEGNTAEVALTEQDWLVLMDFIENPQSKEMIPPTVQEMSVDRGKRTIAVTTADCNVAVTMGL